ncbi:MAG: SIR2 family protein [Melioribacteraceae bacterium]|nr:SIR2 family protein [Melioribacteraceae bacterium]
MIEKFLRYSSTRDVIFVLGAGASNPDGVPLQKELLPMIISEEIDEIYNSEIGKIVNEFLTDNFEFDKSENQFPQLEAVFGFLDYFIAQNESLNSKYTYEKIRDIKEYLIKLIHYVVNLRTDKSSPYYHKFWNLITQHSSNVSIITLNYDTLLEQAFDFIFKKKNGFIDYCIPLMNYEKLPQLKDYNFWVNTREPILVDEDANPNSYKILKLHGSLNWKYCNCCNQILLTPWDRKIDLNKGKFLGYTYPDNKEYEFRCPIDGTEFQTLIMPPSFSKSLNNSIIMQLFSEAAREIRTTKKIVFIGYSLSDADVHIKALFKKAILNDVELLVINHRAKETMELNYRSISKNVKFIYSSFENLLSDNKTIEMIFS